MLILGVLNCHVKKPGYPEAALLWEASGSRKRPWRVRSHENRVKCQEHQSTDMQTRKLYGTLSFSCLNGSRGAQSLCLAKHFQNSLPTKGWTKWQGCSEDLVIWDRLLDSKRQQEPEVWRKSTSTNAFVDRCQRPEANIAYCCLFLLCCGLGKFRLY